MKIWTIQLDIYFFSSAFFSSAFFSLHLQISSSFKPAKAWLICWPQPNYKVSIWSYSQPGVISYQPKYISCNQDKLHAYTFWIILEIRERDEERRKQDAPPPIRPPLLTSQLPLLVEQWESMSFKCWRVLTTNILGLCYMDGIIHLCKFTVLDWHNYCYHRILECLAV